MLNGISKQFEGFKKGFKAKGSFTQNLAITFSGNVVAQLLGFVFTPFIARIYGPEVYGVFALFIAVVNNLSPFSTLQFPTGYVAARTVDEFYRIVKITLMVLFLTTGVSYLIILLFKNELIEIFNVPQLKQFVLWVPVYFLFMGLDLVLLGWNIHLKEFKRGAVAKMFSTIISKGSAIIFGLLIQPSVLGIIIGNLLSYPFESIIKFGPSIRKNINKLIMPSTWRELKATFINFKGYAFFVTPGLIITNLSSQLPVYYFSIVFNQSTVGLFALANSMVNMPLSLIINSSATVFLQKAAETIHRSESELKEIVKSLYRRLFLISFVPLAVLAFASEWIFKIVFGLDWGKSGAFASFLCIGAMFSASYSPLTVLFRLMHYEKINFLLNIFFMVVKFLGLWIGFHYNDVTLSVLGYALATLLSHIVSLMVIFRIVKLSPEILIKDIIMVGALVIIVIFFLY